MVESQSVLLNVWREVCRHIDIGDSIKRITDLLEEHLPVGVVMVQRFDLTRKSLETVASGIIGDEQVPVEPRWNWTDSKTEELTEWCNNGKLGRCEVNGCASEIMRLIVPEEKGRDIVAYPLAGLDGSYGALVLIAKRKKVFNDEHMGLIKVLIDPFSAALENDRRLREMAVLRDAAEADRQSLLTRLGREKLGDSIIGLQSGLREVMERVDLVARSDVPVLIFGETGSGKELIARTIHNRSPRSSGAFIRVNCGAIPQELIDSQLFGHEKGAFTGAASMHRGWFERADGGSLLLDEIAELPPAAQVRLLRVLQDGWFERVGGHEPIHVDVRIVAATHRDLAGMVAEGRFREDLWYRIAVFPIVLPPLKRRREDIPEIARHFARRAATRFGLAEVMPSDQDIAIMTSYDWPGNVRELAAVIDRAAILGNGTRLEVAKALGGISPLILSDDRTRPVDVNLSSATTSLNNTIRLHIESVLGRTKGRIEGSNGAAKLLEINPNTLRAKIRKLGIDMKRFRLREPTP